MIKSSRVAVAVTVMMMGMFRLFDWTDSGTGTDVIAGHVVSRLVLTSRPWPCAFRFCFRFGLRFCFHFGLRFCFRFTSASAFAFASAFALASASVFALAPASTASASVFL